MTLRTPYFNRTKETWYCWIAGRQRSLGVKGAENEDAAILEWHRLASETPTDAADGPNAPKTAPLPSPKSSGRSCVTPGACRCRNLPGIRTLPSGRDGRPRRRRRHEDD